MDIIPISPPGAAVAPDVVPIASTSPVAPDTISQSIGVAVAPLVIAQPSTPGATAPDIIEPGDPSAVIPADLDLPPDYEEFLVSATFNGMDLNNTSRYWGLFASRATTTNAYALSDGDSGMSVMLSGTDAACFALLTNKSGSSGGFRHRISLACLAPLSTPDALYVVVGMRAPADYNMPYNATGLASAIDADGSTRPTLTPVMLGLQGHVAELNILNCRLDGAWDLRGHSALIALRFYGCPSWHKVRLPAVQGLEVSIDDVSATCDILPSETGPYWQTFFARLPDLSGGVGGVIIGPTDLDLVAMLQPIWAASGAASKNWTLI